MSIKLKRIALCAGRPREFDADEALDKALDVFRRKGFEGASLPDLTHAMGISRPSLYATFGNKEELFRKALDRYMERGMKSLHTALAEPTAYRAVEKILTGIADGSACSSTPKGCLLVQGALACGDGAQMIRQELAARRRQVEFLFRQRFERAIAESDLPPDTSASDLAAFIATVIQGMSVQSSGGASREALLGIARTALTAVPAADKIRSRLKLK
jgi:AcrR family transcriptional regulator